ncbi:hypothetical protein BBJ28_00005592 [Nothophytophthora sp. Chile5]|nr:hypothetical protein BBJ28_00005592 [Nothophytophthora sp. Chile5]
MEAIREYASSSSSPSETEDASDHAAVFASASSSTSDAGPSAVAAAASANDAEQRRHQVAQRFIGRARTSAHWSTQEEDAFAFRGYATKRRRRCPSHAIPSAAPAVSDPPSNDAANQTSLFPLDHNDDAGASDDQETRRKSGKLPLLRLRNRRRLTGHDKAVNALQWHPRHPELFLSASMDATVRIWKASPRSDDGCQRVLTHHSLGVKSAKWSLDGSQVLSGGYDGHAVCVDAETGQTRQEVRRPDVPTTSGRVERITTVCFHATEPHSLLLGTDQGRIYGHDLRLKAPTTTYSKSFGDVHDLLFLDDVGQRFVSSAGVLQRDASNQTLLVWDWRSATLLYDRLDSDMLAHSCLRTHPSQPCFVAQCSGNYASLFSTRVPYKKLKGASVDGRRPPLRFAGGHEVEGYSIQCSFAPDGSLWASGDANGRVVLYRTTGRRKVLQRLQLYDQTTPCICAEFRPTPSSGTSSSFATQLVAGSGAGDVDLFL